VSEILLFCALVALGEWVGWWDTTDVSDVSAMVVTAALFAAALFAWAVEQIVDAISSRNGDAE
jgi:hypothetical protein